MKCVAILLAIVVAVAAKDETAATSACPEIDQAKYVYVAEPRVNSCVYSNRLDVPKEWFTAKFYLDDGHIENVPKEGENQCDQEIAADILDGSKFTKALDKRRGQLVDLLNAQWGKDETEGFCKIIHDEHQKVLGEYEQALSDAGREGVITESSEYKAFKSKLDSRKTMAKSQFDCSVTSATSRLQCYHQRIVSRIVQCLSMRKCRIASYDNKMEERKEQMIERYRKSLERVTEAKVKFVTKTLNALYADNEEQKTLDDIAANILKYESNMKECDKALVADYTLKLGQAISEMESNYKCEYKCTFNTGCYSFNRSSYNRKCVTFPTPKKVSYKLVGVAPFKATWKGACQPEKKDCKAQTVDDYKTKDDLATVEETYNKRFKDDEDSLTNKHLEWNAAIADWQKRALGEDGKPGELEEHLNKITKYNCKGEEIEGWQEKAMEGAEAWVSQHAERMTNEAQMVYDQAKCSLGMWKTRQETAIKKLKINFDLCVQRMESRKTCYLEQVRAQRRCAFTRLTNRLTEMKRRTQEQFTKFADASELNKDWDQEVEAESKKEDININITKLLEAAEEKVKKAFNKWWDDQEDLVEDRFNCNAKCSAKFNHSDLCVTFKYTPTIPCYSEYRYC